MGAIWIWTLKFWHWILIGAFSVLEWWFGKLAVGSTWGMVFWLIRRLFERKCQMEKDVALGSNAKLALSFSGGKAIVSIVGDFPGGLSLNLAVQDDAGLLIDQLQEIVAKAAPVTAAIDPIVFGAIKQAVIAIK